MSMAIKTTIISAIVAALVWLIMGRVEQAVIAAVVTGLVHGLQGISPIPGPDRDRPNWLAIVTAVVFVLWAIYFYFSGNTTGVR